MMIVEGGTDFGEGLDVELRIYGLEEESSPVGGFGMVEFASHAKGYTDLG